MILKSFGCSFIFGSDLADDGRDKPWATASQLTWPALLAKQHGYQYQCNARPGSGNLQIMERLLTHVAVHEPAFYVIGWSWIDRFDYPTDDYRSWKTLMPIDTSDTAQYYFKHLHTEGRDKLTSLMAIKLAIDVLKEKNLPFIMTYMDDLLFDNRWHLTPGIASLQQYVRPYMTTFEDLNFLEWSRSKGFAISDTLHPLESAHQAGFELLNPVFSAMQSKI